MPRRESPLQSETPQGTLDMLVLRVLVMGPAHGHTIAHAIERGSEDVLQIEHGSLYPALHRLENRGWIASFWGTSDNNRKAKYYRLTPTGRKQLVAQTTRWEEIVRAIGRILKPVDGVAMSWRRFFRRAHWDRERAEELRSYLEIETDENIARGMSPEAARRAAHLKLGNTVRIREEIYRMNTIGLLDALGRDLRLALRGMRRRPGFTLAVVLTLALGIGANTAIFGVVDGVLLKPLPYPNADELVSIEHVAPGLNVDELPHVAVAVLHLSRGGPRLPAHRSVRRRRDDDHRPRRPGAGARAVCHPRRPAGAGHPAAAGPDLHRGRRDARRRRRSIR